MTDSRNSKEAFMAVPVCSICGKDSHLSDKCNACKAAVACGYKMETDNISGSKQFKDWATHHFCLGYKMAEKATLKERMAGQEALE